LSENIHAYYLDKEQQTHAVYLKQKSRSQMLSWLRVALFLSTILGFWLVISESKPLYNLISIPSLIGFFIALRLYVKKEEEQRFSLAKLNVYRDELLALENTYDHFDDGSIHVDHDHPYSSDLDIFGTGGLFQFLNRTTSSYGSLSLANFLRKTKIPIDLIRNRQKAIQELGEKREWSEDFLASGRLSNSLADEKAKVESWLNTPYKAYQGVFYVTMLKSLPVISIALLSLALMERMPWQIFFLFALIPLTVVGSKVKAMTEECRMLSEFKVTLSKYYRLLEKIENESWESDLTKDLASKLKNDFQSAAGSIKELRKISDALDNRENIVGALVLNSLLLWDVRYGMKILKWKEQYQKDLVNWFDIIGEFEALNSISFVATNRDDLNYPSLSEDKKLIVEAESLGHILLDKNNRVDNDYGLSLPKRFVILTGANMAGKSTFLRALGTNMVLASAGAPVCAEKMVWRPFPLFSSMRTSDSLQSHESYFYAELKRLKQLLDTSDQEEELFIILDEILKGTNSKDKAEGSSLFVEKILSKNIYGIIATHDLSLCELEKSYDTQVENLSFDVSIVDDELHFDYKLKEGICKNMNATFLLNKMGLVS